MLSGLNRLVDIVEEHLAEDIDVNGLARTVGTTAYHLRRMLSSLAGMPLSEYVRRRRMTVAAADVVSGGDDLLSIAVRHGYGSSEAFGRAFRAVHGAGPGDVRRDGGPFRAQPQLRFRLTVEGSTPMDTRIVDRPAFRLVGHAARVPLIHQGVNPHIQEHVASLPAEEHLRLKALSDTEPAGLLAVSDDLDPDRTEGSELTYLALAAGSGDRRRARAHRRLQRRDLRAVAACRTGVIGSRGAVDPQDLHGRILDDGAAGAASVLHLIGKAAASSPSICCRQAACSPGRNWPGGSLSDGPQMAPDVSRVVWWVVWRVFCTHRASSSIGRAADF